MAEQGVRYYCRDLACPVCGLALRAPTPALFSFNSPLGACPTCEGFGRVIGIEGDKLDIRFDKSGDKKIVARFIMPADLADEIPF